MKKYHLSVNERNALIVLSDLQINSVKDLSEYLSLSKTNTSKVLSSLERKNLIIRILDKSDKRHNQIFLTETGRETADEMIIEISDLFEKRIAQFPDQLGEKLETIFKEYGEYKKLNSQSSHK